MKSDDIFVCATEKFDFQLDFRVDNGLEEQKQCDGSCALDWCDALGLRRRSWIRRERIWIRRERIRASRHSPKVGQRAVWEHHWWLPSGHFQSKFSMRVCANLTLSFKCNFLDCQAKSVSARSGETSKWNYFNIVQNCLGWIKVTKSDQSDQGTQIGQTCIKLLTLIYFSPKTLRWRFFMLFHNIFIYHHQLVWWPLRVPGESRVISHQSETISKFAFHNPHNFTQHSKGRINPNFDNVSTWKRSHWRNNWKNMLFAHLPVAPRVHKNRDSLKNCLVPKQLRTSCIYK